MHLQGLILLMTEQSFSILLRCFSFSFFDLQNNFWSVLRARNRLRTDNVNVIEESSFFYITNLISNETSYGTASCSVQT